MHKDIQLRGLRDGSEALNSNRAIAGIMAEAAYGAGVPEGAIQLISNTDRGSVIELMQLSGIIDVLIPREVQVSLKR